MINQSSPAVKTENLVKTYRGHDTPSVDSLNLTIEKGEIFGLLGPNGAGKTTTISMITGLLRPTSGNISLFGTDIRTNKKSKKMLGLVPQDIALYPSLTAYENLTYIASMYSVEKLIAKAKINELLNTVGLTKSKDKRISTYSGGMKRRVNLLAAILHDPTLLILDEPTVGIDVQSKNSIIEFLKDLNQKGMTILYTSHHLDEAQEFCTNIAILDLGKIVAIGKPKTLIENETDVKDLNGLFLKLTGKTLRD